MGTLDSGFRRNEERAGNDEILGYKIALSRVTLLHQFPRISQRPFGIGENHFAGFTRHGLDFKT